MNLSILFSAIDRKPFQPFTIELLGGRRIAISNPECIFILPNRQTVLNIEVDEMPSTQFAMFGPEGIVGISFDVNGANGS